MNPPRAGNIGSVDAVKVPEAHKIGPVVLGNDGSVGQLKGLVLYLCCVGVQRERGQDVVLDVGAAIQEDVRVKTPERAKDFQ